MRGERKFIQAKAILSMLYKKDYELEGKLFSREELYNKYLKLLRKSAYLGYSEAQYELGLEYDDINFWGRNPLYSPKKCMYWYAKASEQGVASAYNNLGSLYERGEGAPQNIAKALECYTKAGLLGDSLGKKNRRVLLKQIKEGKYIL